MPRKQTEITKAMAAARGRKADVAGDLARLKGSSRNDLVPDRDRGSASPLGHGSYSKKGRERR